MNDKGVGIGGVVTTIGWIAQKKGDWVEEKEAIEKIQGRFDASREVAEFAIQLAEHYNVVERKDGKIRVKERVVKTV